MTKDKFKWGRAELIDHARAQVPGMLPDPSVVDVAEDADDAAESIFAFWVKEDGLDSPDTLAEEQRDEWADCVIEAVANAIRESQNERRKS